MIISKNKNYLIYFFIIVLSILSSLYLRDFISINNQALGKHTIIFFIPFVLYGLYFLFIENYRFTILKYIFFCFIVFIPAYEILTNEIFHIKGDDSWSYSRLAQFISENLSFKGNPEGISYYRQPGFTYFYAMEILFFKYESRLLQLFNLVLFFLIFFYLLELISKKITNFFYLKIIIFLSIPYAIKNILYTYSEWFFLLVFFLSIICYRKKYYLFFVILFSFTVFVRQNFLFSYLLILSIFIINSNILILKKFIYSFIALLIFLIPLFHNLYYAQEFKIISNNGMNMYEENYQEITQNMQSDSNIAYANLNSKIFEYLNIFWIINNFNKIIKHIYVEHLSWIFLMGYNQDFLNICIGLFVLPSILFLLYLFIWDESYVNILIGISLLLLTYIVSFIAGGGSFPRFEFSIFYYLLFSKIIIKEIDFRRPT